MQGSIIYPLNDMAQTMPDLYHKNIEKYSGREHIMRERVATLNDALWNDCVFLCPINPDLLYQELAKVNLRRSHNQSFYKIPISSLDTSRLTIFKFTSWKNGKIELKDDLIPYNKEYLIKRQSVPQDTIGYYEDMSRTGTLQVPLFFRYVPHVLHLGPIDVSNSKIVTVN